MRTRIASCLLAPIFLLIFVIGGLFFYDGSLHSTRFPYQQSWSVELDGVVTAISTDSSRMVLARTGSQLYALDAETGSILWSHALTRQASAQPALAANGLVYIADRRNLWALDSFTGTVIWQQPVPVMEAEVRSVSSDYLAVDVAQDIYIYHAGNGSLLWNKAVCRNDILAYIDEPYVYIPCYSIRAVHLVTGEDAWEVDQPSRIVSVTYEDGIMVYSPEPDKISALDLRSREELWNVEFKGEGFRRLNVLSDKIIVTDSEKVCSLEKRTGNRNWCKQFRNPLNPTLVNDTLFIFNGAQNNITAIDWNSGQVIGSLKIKRLTMLVPQRELMGSVNTSLIFASGNQVFAFSPPVD